MSNKAVNLLPKVETFFQKAEYIAIAQPACVVIAMHEYFRSLYPMDPYIAKRYSEDYIENIDFCIENLIGFLDCSAELGTYLIANSRELKLPENSLEIFTDLWEKRFADEDLKSEAIIDDLYQANNMRLKDVLIGKDLVDIGCGSGRFSVAFSRYCSKVTGVDLNLSGLDVAKRYAFKNNVNNVDFVHSNVLALPFKDKHFDFCFSKGVLHHTGNLKLGIQEFMRVMKDGGSGFLYLYGSGGLFWASRQRMREVFKLIPKKTTASVLMALCLPSRRTIFFDSWYVPIEEHCDLDAVTQTLYANGAKRVTRLLSPRPFELDRIVSENPELSFIWGNGEIRLHIEK
jgi:SAM-dependent methyltransferase